MKIPFDDDEAADQFFEELLKAVDQQLRAKETSYVADTLKRLIDEGMEADEARESIARCLATITDEVLRSGRPFDEKAYRMSLERISPES